jgi:hypothetical protein
MANGMERKALAPLEHVVPRSFPAGMVTLGAAPTSTKPLATTNKERRNEYIFKKTILTF